MKLESFLRERGIPFQKSLHAPAFTSQEMAAEEHVSGYNVAKPVVVKGRRQFAMCVVPACRHLDLPRVAEYLHERKVRLATEIEMRDLFPGCELGAEPPAGELFGMRTVLDERLHQDEFLVMQTGKHTESLKVRRRDFEEAFKPEVAAITE